MKVTHVQTHMGLLPPSRKGSLWRYLLVAISNLVNTFHSHWLTCKTAMKMVSELGHHWLLPLSIQHSSSTPVKLPVANHGGAHPSSSPPLKHLNNDVQQL